MALGVELAPAPRLAPSLVIADPGFPVAVAILLLAEGGYGNDPHDKGGATNFGISTPVWEIWRASLGKAGQNVRACTLADAVRIYRAGYWVRGGCDRLSWPLSLVHFDSMVQHGLAGTLLQKTVGVAKENQDNKVGAQTIAAANALDPRAVAEDLIWTRLAYYRSLHDPVHADGWLARMVTLRAFVAGKRPLLSPAPGA